MASIMAKTSVAISNPFRSHSDNSNILHGMVPVQSCSFFRGLVRFFVRLIHAVHAPMYISSYPFCTSLRRYTFTQRVA